MQNDEIEKKKLIRQSWKKNPSQSELTRLTRHL
jgi:hypothetical protein